MAFCVTKWFQRKSHFKRKNMINKNKKLQSTHACFPFHHGPCTRRVFKFCLRNQSAENKVPTSHFYSRKRKRSMEHLGVPGVKQGEGFFYFDCNMFYFGRIKLSWYSRQAFCGCSVSYGTYVGCFTTKIIYGHT